jgi:hypothetical protein
MKKYGSVPQTRYTMTHGELLPADKSEDTMPLYYVLLTLHAKVSPKEKEFYFELPEEAMLSLQYRRRDGGMVSYTAKDVLQLNSDAILELKQAMEMASKDSRPIISYVYSSKQLKNIARLTVVYSEKDWQCVLATGVSYAEVNFIYELLSRYNLAKHKNPTLD